MGKNIGNRGSNIVYWQLIANPWMFTEYNLIKQKVRAFNESFFKVAFHFRAESQSGKRGYISIK